MLPSNVEMMDIINEHLGTLQRSVERGEDYILSPEDVVAMLEDAVYDINERSANR